METMNKRIFITTRYPVSAQHGRPPSEFLQQLVETLDALPDDVLPKMSFMISMPS